MPWLHVVPAQVDRGLRLGMSMKVGPLRLADTIGLDTCLAVMKVGERNASGIALRRVCVGASVQSVYV
jgi:3-hydroxyacyl-CoA dehydrogenase